MRSLENLLLDQTRLRRAGAIAAYLACTILIAYWVGTQQLLYLYLAIQVGILLYLILWAQRRAWVLILLGWSLTGATAFFRIPISIRDFSVMASFCAYMVYRVVSGDAMRQRWCLLDAIIALNAVYLIFTFYLNPVGLASLGAETIGARPYFTTFLAVVGYWVIWRLPNSIKTISRIPLFILVGSAITVSLYAGAYFFPSLPARIPILYAALNVNAYFGNVSVMKEAGGGDIIRYKELGFFGALLCLTLYSYRPSLTILNPLRPRFYVLLAGMFCVFLSGFRGAFVGVCALFAISVWLHSGFKRFLITCAVGVALLLALAGGQGHLYNLPLSAQRTLTTLPGKWDPVVVLDAEGSSKGRFEWWKAVISENLIKNWWFGDGFGASVSDVMLASQHGASAMAEVTGALHSGPLTSVRYVGVVGLVLMYTLMIVSAVNACRCVRKCRGTLLQPVSLYLAIQMVWYPLDYTLIFGAYDADMPQVIFLAGLLRVVMRMSDNMPAAQTNESRSLVRAMPRALSATT